MNQNIGTIDRILRLLVGAALIAFALGLILPGTGWNQIGWIGIVPIVTALVRICPLYSILGLRT